MKLLRLPLFPLPLMLPMDSSPQTRNAVVVARELAFVPLDAKTAADPMVAAAVDAVIANAPAVMATPARSRMLPMPT